MDITRHLRIHGRVQGVWFRAWAVRTADELGLVGWVRNCPDGSVEAVIQGDAACVTRFIELAQLGPPQARVTRVDVAPAETVSLTGFEKRRTPPGA